VGELAGARRGGRGVLPEKAGQVQWRKFNTAEGGLGALSSSLALGPSEVRKTLNL
jgi:hypothetical protein